MQRISRCTPPVLPFSPPPPEKNAQNPDPPVELDEGEVRAWPWVQEIRKLIKADGCDKPGPQELKRTG